MRASIPARSDFSLEAMGVVLRGEVVERTGTFTNSRRTAVEVTGLSVTGAAFSLVGPTSLEVPAGGSATVKLRFSPASFGAQQGELWFDGSPMTLLGFGIGPALELDAERLDLGTVPLYDGAPALGSARLIARNVGRDATPSRPETALQLFFDVLPTSAAPADELCVGDCASTQLSLAVDALTIVPITLTSTTPGLKTWDVRVFSNDPSAPMRTVAVSAEVVARPTCQLAVPAALAFGVLTSPERRDLEVLLENVGTELCEVNKVELGAEQPLQSPPLFSLLEAPTTTRSIGPGEVLRLTVRAAPQGAPPRMPLTIAGLLRVEFNHPDGVARIPLSAQLELTCLTAAPAPLDFATVQTGCRSADRQVKLRNICPRPLLVSSATLPGFSSFSVSGALPRTLAPNQTLTLTARYAPFALGPSRDVIDVTWVDAMVTKHTTVELRGEAGADGVNEDRFPPRGNKLDVLLVLDDSASMADKATRMSAQLPTLIDALQRHNVDFQLGVIDANQTSSGSEGVLRTTSTGLRWLTAATPGLRARFAELTAYTGTHNTESCEVPVLRALSAPNISDPSINGGFLRPDASLEVLCVTDRSEEALLLEQVLQLKAERLRWDVIGPVGPQQAGCSNEWNPSQTGNQQYTQATRGAILDLCASDWSSLLEDVAAQTIARRSFFPLRARPDPVGTPPLAVSVAGQDVSAVTAGGAAVWAWESAPNAVLFTPLFAPAASELVTISYPVACAP